MERGAEHHRGRRQESGGYSWGSWRKPYHPASSAVPICRGRPRGLQASPEAPGRAHPLPLVPSQPGGGGAEHAGPGNEGERKREHSHAGQQRLDSGGRRRRELGDLGPEAKRRTREDSQRPREGRGRGVGQGGGWAGAELLGRVCTGSMVVTSGGWGGPS